MARQRLLFLAEGATMQHFVRPMVLADGLDLDLYEPHLYAPARYQTYLTRKPYATGELAAMPEGDFLRNLARGAPLFSAATLRGYVEEERQLIRRLKPDLVIGDLRFSLPLSAKLESVKSAVLMNAYWSPFAQRRSIIPELPITRLIPPKWLGRVYRWTEPTALSLHVRGINAVRRDFDFAPLPPDPRHMYTDGDFVLYPDISDLVPAPHCPPTHRFIGPCNWEWPGAKPDWWEGMLADPRPKVLVSLGSSGPVRILPRLLEVLAPMPVAIVLTTSGRIALPSSAQSYVAPLLPFAETVAACRLVISHGAVVASTPLSRLARRCSGSPATPTSRSREPS